MPSCRRCDVEVTSDSDFCHKCGIYLTHDGKAKMKDNINDIPRDRLSNIVDYDIEGGSGGSSGSVGSELFVGIIPEPYRQIVLRLQYVVGVLILIGAFSAPSMFLTGILVVVGVLIFPVTIYALMNLSQRVRDLLDGVDVPSIR